MSEQTAAPANPTPEERQQAIRAYYDAKTNKDKAEVVKRFPILETIFSAGNHHVTEEATPAAKTSETVSGTNP